jgi:ABC-2 type transport system permease protein
MEYTTYPFCWNRACPISLTRLYLRTVLPHQTAGYATLRNVAREHSEWGRALVRAYLAAARLSFRRYRTYRAANIGGLVTNGFFGVVRSYVFIALFQNRPVAEGYDLADALTYVWVTQALIMPLYIWSWQEIALTIRSGAVATDLARPISYFGYWLSQDLGRALYHILYRLVPTIAIGLVLFRVSLPHGPLAWLAFPLALVIAIVISFAFRFMVNVAAFWMTDLRGIYAFATIFVNLLSGFLVPLAFFPAGLRDVIQYLPFAGMVSIPLNVYLGRFAPGELLAALALQLAWAAIFIAAAHALLNRATRKLVVQGG